MMRGCVSVHPQLNNEHPTRQNEHLINYRGVQMNTPKVW